MNRIWPIIVGVMFLTSCATSDGNHRFAANDISGDFKIAMENKYKEGVVSSIDVSNLSTKNKNNYEFAKINLTDVPAIIVKRNRKTGEQEAVYASRIIVKLANGYDLTSLKHRISLLNIPYKVGKSLGDNSLFLLIGTNDESQISWQYIDELESEPEIKLAEVDYVIEMENNQHLVKFHNSQWSLDNLAQNRSNSKFNIDVNGLDAISRLHYSRTILKPVIVAVIDTGIAADHPALKDSLWLNTNEIPNNGQDDDNNGYVDDIYGWNVADGSNNIYDLNGHGTHVAGIIAAKPHHESNMAGLATHARLMTLKMTFANTKYTAASLSAEAINYAVANGAQVVNMSYGKYEYSQSEDDAIRNGTLKVHFVAAAGNNGDGPNQGTDVGKKPYYPCAIAGDCVASINSDGDLSPFSNYQNLNLYISKTVDIAAPGGDIYSTIPPNRYKVMSGTSMATPHVSAVYANILSKYPEENWVQNRRRVLDGAYRIPKLDNKVFEGKILNAYRSIFMPTPSSAYTQYSHRCDERIDGEARRERWPYANWGDPGIDGTTKEKAFEICTLKQLLQIRENDLDKHFVLLKNLDGWKYLTSTERKMIGQNGGIFNGILWGDGYTIRDIEFTGHKDIGLIRRLGPNGRVIGLRISNAKLSGDDTVGILAGSSQGGINDVQVDGVVNGKDYVGGIVGQQSGGFIHNSYFGGHIDGPTRGYCVGGIVGSAEHGTSLFRLHAKTKIVAKGTSIGGIVGRASWNVKIEQVYSQAFIESNYRLGGIAGELNCESKIIDSYVEGVVNGSRSTGGMVGYIENSQVKNSYSMSIVKGGNTIGGLVAERLDNLMTTIWGQPEHFYRCTGSSTIAPLPSSADSSYWSTDSNPNNSVLGKPLNRTQLYDKTNFKGWTFGVPWTIPAGYTPALMFIPRTAVSSY